MNTNSEVKIKSLINLVKSNKLNLTPIYQRGYVWDCNKMVSPLIKSILNEMPIGILTFHQKSKELYDIIDGQQRTTSILKFVTGELKLSQEISIRIIKEKINLFGYNDNFDDDRIKLNKKILSSFGSNKKISLSFEQLPYDLQDLILNTKIPLSILDGISDIKIQEYFVDVQNSSPLTGGEILKQMVLPIIKSVSFITEPTKTFNAVFGLTGKRNDDVKILCNVYGILDNKLALGCSDKVIVDYFKKNKVFDETIINKINRIDSFINYLVSKKIKMKLKKQNLKLLLLLLASSDDSFETLMTYDATKIEILNKILTDIKIFSAKNASIKINNQLNCYSSDESNQLLTLNTLLKGIHKWNNFKGILPTITTLVESQNKYTKKLAFQN